MSLKELLKSRSQIKSALTRYKNFIDKLVAEDSICGLQQRLGDAKKLLQEFKDVQSNIEIVSDIDVDDQTWEEFEDRYYACITISDKLLERHSANQSQISSNSNPSLNNSGQINQINAIQLPLIDLPKFSGSYTEWLPFFNRFNSIIHKNQGLDNSQKMYYLQSNLTGEAKRYVDTLPEADDNYEKAWAMLEERFKNTRLTVQNHVYNLFNLKPANLKSSRKSLRELLDEFSLNLAALETPSLHVEFKDTLLIYLLSSKLDYVTKNEWETRLKPNELPKLNDLVHYVKQRCQTIEAIDANPLNHINSNYNKLNTIQNMPKQETKRKFLVHNQSLTCSLCKQNHYLNQCAEFLKLNINDRTEQVKRLKHCFNCLKSGHDSKVCRASTCRICSNKHHTLLHFNNQRSVNNLQNHSVDTQTQNLQVCQVNSAVEVMLSTAVVTCFDKEGNTHNCKVLLDPGSQQNLITEKLCKKLNLNIQSVEIGISGVCNINTKINKSCDFKFKSMYNNYGQQIKCLVVPIINGNFPIETFDKTDISIPDNINLADPDFNVSAPIDVLMGAELFWNLLDEGRIKAANKLTTIQNTRLGWVLGGPFTTAAIEIHNNFCNNININNADITNFELEKQIIKFWELENYNSSATLTNEEKICEELFENTHKRDENGKFIVRLPFKADKPLIINNKEIAFRRFRALENKFYKNPGFKKEYCMFMKEYIELNHMQLANSDNSKNFREGCFLPHHGVIKKDSLTTKLRAVFDASCKPASGYSLNDHLLPGPNLQKELFTLLVKFRKHKYVLSADVVKMFRQIWVAEEDKKYLKILWRANTEDPIEIYNLSTVTYGTVCAPYLAMKCVQKLGTDFENCLPEASRVIKEDFYMDDLITGANSIQGAIELRNNIIDILKTGGFELAKWASNNSELLPDIKDKANNKTQVRLDSDMKTKTLGLIWNCERDTLSYDIKIKNVNPIINKRFVLSVIATIYDPIGLLNPLVLTAKLILQKLWQLKLDWDDNLPSDLYKKFETFMADLPNISQLEIPRKIIEFDPYEKIELHGFSDASIKAYGAAIYVRVTGKNNKYKTNLVCAKSRIAPLKETTLPRLELCAAVLLAKLINKISKILNINDCYMWSDSTITLAWITSSPQRWQPFVRNRVIEIQSHTEINQWRHIRSANNPADIISRGANISELKDSKLWWYGPSFLSQTVENWPILNIDKPAVIPEERKIIILNSISTTENFSLLDKFSSFKKLKRVVAYCFRFYNNCKTKNNIKVANNISREYPLNLTIVELEEAEIRIIKLVQNKAFGNEIQNLKRSKQINSNSNLKSLNIFLDKRDLLRVGGRIQRSNLDFDTKHQILLPKSHNVTKLIIRNTHEKELHAGAQATLAAVRRKFWPIAGRSVVREIIHKCVKCYRTHPKTYEELMGNLPIERVTAARPFLKCGVDYAGPLTLKLERGRSKKIVKSYVVVFVCMATKAIHLELTFDYTAESFFNVLKRMMARRGKVSHLYSDNGTNFVGANHELEKIRNLLLSKEFKSTVIAQLIDEGIEWKFIPPRSPYVGGIWEAGVKAFKQHFKKVTGSVLITVEEMYTLLALIESCLNSRPLTPLSNDPNDLEVLTPGHFLIGEAITAPLEPQLVEVQDNRLSRWQRVEKLRQLFWKRWQNEYLTEQQRRNKWHKKSDVPIKVGSMVVLRDENLPPLQWKLGRIVELHPGMDGVTRVVTIKTATTTTKRGVNRLCVLPIESE